MKVTRLDQHHARTTPPPITATFNLVNHHGEAVTEQTYHGKRLLVFFGFTHCKAVCPRALARLSAVLDRLGPHAELLEPLYITVDPDRDTPEVMKEFLERNFPRFTGLTGSSKQISDAKSAFRVFAHKVADPDDPAGYQMPHSAFTYLLDAGGQYVTHFTDAVDEDELTHRLQQLLNAATS